MFFSYRPRLSKFLDLMVTTILRLKTKVYRTLNWEKAHYKLRLFKHPTRRVMYQGLLKLELKIYIPHKPGKGIGNVNKIFNTLG